MKKFVFAILCVCLCVQPCLAFYDINSDNKAAQAKINTFRRKMKLLVKDTEELADKIAAFNKPVFEAKLTRKEREYIEMGDETPSISPIIWNRVFAKDKTLVFGFALRDGKTKAYFMKTAEPDFYFHGLHVGSDIRAVEKFFGDSINNISYKSGDTLIIYGPGGETIFTIADFLDAAVNIRIKNGKITEINYDRGGNFDDFRGGTLSLKAVNFAEQQARQMGLSSINGGLPVYFNESSGQLMNIQ